MSAFRAIREKRPRHACLWDSGGPRERERERERERRRRTNKQLARGARKGLSPATEAPHFRGGGGISLLFSVFGPRKTTLTFHQICTQSLSHGSVKRGGGREDGAKDTCKIIWTEATLAKASISFASAPLTPPPPAWLKRHRGN